MNSVKQQIGNSEFVALMAVLMSLVALTIDAMLPALGHIGINLGVQNQNDVQHVISTIFLGMALGFMLYGPISDSFGRKKAIYLGFVFFFIGNFVSLLSPSFTGMLCGRVLQGFGIASCRVVTLAMIRDKFEGREMARIMSLIMMIFIIIPALAPSMGQGILLLFHWKVIFVLFLLIGMIGFLWMFFRLPETLPTEKRLPFSFATISSGILETIKNPVSRGYTIAAGLVFGAFIGYLNSAQQILQIQYGLGKLFSIYFGILALAIGVAFFANSKLVLKFGMEKLCRVSLLVMTGSALCFYFYAYTMAGNPPLFAFVGYLLITFFCFGILFGNFNALAVEPLGHIAGVANSVIGSIQTLLSVGLGGLVGQFYNGSVLPVVLGFVVFGALSLAVTTYTERRVKFSDLAKLKA